MEKVQIQDNVIVADDSDRDHLREIDHKENDKNN